ncbi:hypothetical protein BCT61_04580 [Vibrio breoganii]|uniref:hypothetical protein n=1 Tax=Vibrio breoganii TaxID=553239 RepID=UPI000C854008|nr:hypothetical protein [Vibrio breoganii]PMM12627.1 hypothetical protein BCT61_04580 [Vibrio breoganii]
MTISQMQSNAVRFDYTHFLGESSRGHRWRFVDVIHSIAPIFGTLWLQEIDKAQNSEQKLWESALNQLSSTHSDEKNLIKLLRIAKQENIESLEISLPYSFEQEQIEAICARAEVKIECVDEELWKVTL